jgi:hypothetical protein
MRNTVLLVLLVLLVLTTGCLPDPQRMQSAELLDRLASARVDLSHQPLPNMAACTTIGDAQNRLFGEPGLVEVRPAWPDLRDAANALQAVCGQATLLSVATQDSTTALQARQRWKTGIQREIGVACDHLRDAARELSRAAPC